MKRIAIKTAGTEGKNLYNMLKNNICYSDLQIICFAEKSAALIHKRYKDTPIVSDFALSTMYSNREIEKVIIPCELFRMGVQGAFLIQQIYDDLIKLGISYSDILISNLPSMQNDGRKGFDSDFVEYDHFFHIRYLEFPIAYHCNLNCKGCSHFSPLIKEEFPVYEEVEKDFIKLKEFIPHIGRIRILGGEPLLNPEIDKYIRLTRRLYPYSEIIIVTNGLLVKKMSEELIKCMKENDISIHISVYPPLYKTVDTILAFLKDEDIKATISNSSEFMPTFSKNKSKYPYVSLERTCRYYYFADGYLSPCMLMHDIKFFNEYFGENLNGDDALINIHDDKLTQALLMKKLKTPVELCDHCAMYKHMALDLAFLYHTDMNIGWERYSKDDKPMIDDWYERE